MISAKTTSYHKEFHQFQRLISPAIDYLFQNYIKLETLTLCGGNLMVTVGFPHEVMQNAFFWELESTEELVYTVGLLR